MNMIPNTKSKQEGVKLYWFIPDGFRADPDTFNIYRWADEGRLPNIKKLMDKGSYGYSIPTFPGHTPTNTATLVTGTYPKTHGVIDGGMRSQGYPLKMVALNGFSSVAKKVSPIWYTLEENGNKVALLSMPGSTPPELHEGMTLRGRWGGWGADFPAIIFNSDKSPLAQKEGMEHRSFSFGPHLTKFTSIEKPAGWSINLPKSTIPPVEMTLSAWGNTTYAYIYSDLNSSEKRLNKVLLSLDKKTELVTLKEGDWSSWLPISLIWETKNDYNIHTPKNFEWERNLSSLNINTFFRIRIIKLRDENSIRIRLFYDNLNELNVQPSTMNALLHNKIGPMVDFVDNYPPQLIYDDEDKTTFLEESNFSLDWHKNLVREVLSLKQHDVVIHNIYTPNQMLTSRWWLPYIDPNSKKYTDMTSEKRNNLWSETLSMYKKIDDILGEIMKGADENTLIVLSSDHGAVPLWKEVHLNNLFAQKGLLKFNVNPKTHETSIDWKKSKVVFLQMNHIFINPDGLDGPYFRRKGPQYETLRDQVIEILKNLKDENNISPIADVLKWEDSEKLNLEATHAGDLIIAAKSGFSWTEEVSKDLQIFKSTLKGGYKQGLDPKNEKGLWTPFIIAGPNVKANYQITEPILHIDQYPTIMNLLKKPVPSFVEGHILQNIISSKKTQ